MTTIPVTVVIPYHPSRMHNGMLLRALDSIEAQTMQPESVITVEDNIRAGATRTRQRGLDAVSTELVTFLDSDDEMLPHHLETLYTGLREHGADMTYSWYRVVGGTDPRPKEFGLEWDPKNPRQTTIVTLSKTDLAQQVGFVEITDRHRQQSGEDWYFTQGMNKIGKIVHIPKRTWLWYHHGYNTSGMPTKGDA